ncbi:MAG: HlyD family secretion protein [Phycisphaerales bacterium]|nr:HlyD family secretion protein [Phycisphaerales bacterium]
MPENPSSVEPPASTMPPVASKPPGKGFRRASIAVFLIVVLLVITGAGWLYFSTRGTESTDDAFIAATTYSIAPRVAGRITTILVDDNAVVEQGQLLAEIDPAGYEAALDHATASLTLAQAQQKESEIQVVLIDATTRAAVATAEADIEAAEARLQQVQADLEAAQADQSRASAELERYSTLSDRAVTALRLDEVRSASQNADARVRSAQKLIASSQAELTASRSRLDAANADRQRVDAARAEVERRGAEVAQAEATLRRAELDLSYTKILAPGPGRVTAKAVSRGDYVAVGQPMMAVVSTNAWVIANFKETQLTDMEVGQSVNVHIDAYGVDLPGRVDSIQAGSGAQFSLLPPQNATGNYVKVVQRVPVKITFNDADDSGRYLLGPGMSVVPKVITR